MNKNVIHIYGASGSGTSTLGKYICQELGYFFMDSDDYFWEPTNPPYTTKRTREKRIELMKHDISIHENVVISGALANWGNELIPKFTLVIRLVTDTSLRIERLKQREKEHFGSRIEKGGDMYENHIKFIEWAASYDTGGIDVRSKKQHDQWQKLLQCKQITLNGANTLEDNLNTIKQYL